MADANVAVAPIVGNSFGIAGDGVDQPGMLAHDIAKLAQRIQTLHAIVCRRSQLVQVSQKILERSVFDCEQVERPVGPDDKTAVVRAPQLLLLEEFARTQMQHGLTAPLRNDARVPFSMTKNLSALSPGLMSCSPSWKCDRGKRAVSRGLISQISRGNSRSHAQSKAISIFRATVASSER